MGKKKVAPAAEGAEPQSVAEPKASKPRASKAEVKDIIVEYIGPAGKTFSRVFTADHVNSDNEDHDGKTHLDLANEFVATANTKEDGSAYPRPRAKIVPATTAPTEAEHQEAAHKSTEEARKKQK